MSLTSFVKLPEVTEEILRHWPVPNFEMRMPLLAPPGSKNYALVGTAFDYLFRFYLKRLYPDCIEKKWVAEYSINPIFLHSLFEKQINQLDLNKSQEKSLKALEAAHHKTGQSIIERAKNEQAKFIKFGEITDEIIRSVIELAKLDAVYRAGYIYTDLAKLTQSLPEDIQDIRRLFEIIPKNNFAGKRNILLNPTFENASEIVGGADCDFVMDQEITDLKTTKYLQLTKDYWTQLVGYAILADITTDKKFPKIKTISIYYSRHAAKWEHSTAEIYNHPNYDKFKEWFIERAQEAYSV